MDVHDWRRKRDIVGYGKMMHELIESKKFVTSVVTCKSEKIISAVHAKRLVSRISRKLSRKKSIANDNQKRSNRARRNVKRRTGEDEISSQRKKSRRQRVEKPENDTNQTKIMEVKNEVNFSKVTKRPAKRQSEISKIADTNNVNQGEKERTNRTTDLQLQTLSAKKLKEPSDSKIKSNQFMVNNIPDILENTIENI